MMRLRISFLAKLSALFSFPKFIQSSAIVPLTVSGCREHYKLSVACHSATTLP
ncbi:hypothetical protein L228DRAFT_243157 [Xylona heveae TC161]|uniref:Uncharacterized protein n=1 Tax=Xylona heveae (strain CBS 132557 / TC161) TaxID=1328760 RepID=A0A165JUS6_XYLHT|nr:hypothetical protein L228DRAFT_243157 [Xylona heveae TC161]KZF26658.1 hypothetical protein L228DRAFT_243157 [Xylona heveae TC161]